MKQPAVLIVGNGGPADYTPPEGAFMVAADSAIGRHQHRADAIYTSDCPQWLRETWREFTGARLMCAHNPSFESEHEVECEAEQRKYGCTEVGAVKWLSEQGHPSLIVVGVDAECGGVLRCLVAFSGAFPNGISLLRDGKTVPVDAEFAKRLAHFQAAANAVAAPPAPARATPPPNSKPLRKTKAYATKRMVLVGNGPSASQYCDEIDAHDIIVRVNGFPVNGAGSEWDIWAGGFGPQAIANIRRCGCIASKPDIVWSAGGLQHLEAIGGTEGAKVYQSTPARYNRLREALGGAPPTSGFLALEMALMSGPKALTVVGFDAVAPDKPGWCHIKGLPPVKTEQADEPHDMAAEKKLIGEWVKTKRFCGRKYPGTKPAWLRLKDEATPWTSELEGQRVLIVGNGPSAPQYAKEIDAFDGVVVRVNAFPIGEAGNRWDAWFGVWAGKGGDYMIANKMAHDPAVPKWLWTYEYMMADMHLTLRRVFPKGFEARTSLLPRVNASRISNAIGEASDKELLRHPTNGNIRPIQATAGIFAIDLALYLGADEVVLVGFDAERKGAPGWCHYGSDPCEWSPDKPSPSNGQHDYGAEKPLIREWMDTRVFFGQHYPNSKPVWWKLRNKVEAQA